MYALFSNDFSASVSGSACNVQSIGFYAMLLDLAISLVGDGSLSYGFGRRLYERWQKDTARIAQVQRILRIGFQDI
jgi:hypothetical protein